MRKIEILLPEAFDSIHVESGSENMLGEMLVIRTKSGIEIKINALHLGQHEVGITAEKLVGDGTVGGYINIDPFLPTEVGLF